MFWKKSKITHKCHGFMLWFLAFCVTVAGMLPATVFSADENFEDNGPLILEPVIQNYTDSEYAYAYEINSKLYIPMSQLAVWVGLQYTKDAQNINLHWNNSPQDVKVNLKNKTVDIDGKKESLQNDDFKFLENELFVSDAFLKRVLNIEASVESLSMQLKIDSPFEFPTTTAKNAKKRRSNGIYHREIESFKEYSFDERWFDLPVADLTIGKGWARSKGGRTNNSDSYSLTLAGLTAGMDFNAYISGDSYNDRKPTFRLNASREFINEPKNKLNMKQLEIGDLSGVGNSYFASAASGRGVTASSFKNFVTSADKTIDISGPLQDGWQVELYWNEQLLGYRQNAKDGQYNFPNIPVSYGLNVFKLVFYGPYGEVRTEEKRYYSGTSPVKTGEFGYTFSAYQPDRYIIEKNEPMSYERKSDRSVLDMVGYYGLHDNLTLIGGYTQTPNIQKTITQNFAMTGLQYAIDGLSVQYNLERNLDNNKTGHHVEAQGDVYIGTLYAAADNYNGIHSPNSEVGGDYVKSSYEARLSGMLPYYVPYYLSWKNGRYESNNYHFDEILGRLSKQVGMGVNLNVENSYFNSHRHGGMTDELRFGAYKWWGAFTTEAWLTYNIKPDTEFKEVKLRADFRTGRRTYISGEYTHNLQNDMDYLSISASKVFSFGGLSLTFSTDRDFNLSTYITYNISLAKEPYKNSMLYTGNSRFGDTGSLYVTVKDEFDKPIEGLGINANGLEKEVYTDDDGHALLSDLQTYEKTNVRVDAETLPDVSLQPVKDEYKLVLRPGTIRTLEMNFVHKGAVEGQLANPYGNIMFGYMIAAINDNDEEAAKTFADTSGMFILDDVPYGKYKLVISKDGHILAEKKDIVIDDTSIYLEGEIWLDTSQIEDENLSIPDYLKDEVLFEAPSDDASDEIKEELKPFDLNLDENEDLDFYNPDEDNFVDDLDEIPPENDTGKTVDEIAPADAKETEEEYNINDQMQKRILKLKEDVRKVLKKAMRKNVLFDSG